MTPTINIDRLDHLGFRKVTSADGRVAPHFGRQKINLHRAGHEHEPKAHVAAPGSADLCFVTKANIDHALAHLRDLGVAVLLGPVPRAGAEGEMTSVYFRDRDLNLIEISHYP